jgi:putative PIN family toxin of toxin-antitoxin system
LTVWLDFCREAGRNDFVPVVKIVLDTSVLISALRSRQGASFRLLSLVGDPRWQMLLSPALLFEYEAVAQRQAAELWATPEKVENILDFLCATAIKPTIAYTWRPNLPDPNDDMLLELAVAGGASNIVTHNSADFRGANQFGIGILSPGEFLRTLENQP